MIQPHTDARTKSVRRRKPGDIGQLRTILWGVLLEVESIVKSPTDDQTKLRAVSSLATAAGVYLQAIEVGELEKRLNRLEEKISVGGGGK